MVEVFKTNIHKREVAIQIIGRLQPLFPDGRINFDLDDCDRILRVEALEICCEAIIALLNADGYECLALA